MALTNAQIIALALQIAKTPGYTSQAGQIYNAVLEELAESYDFDIQKVTSFSLITGTLTTFNGAGPFNLPQDYLRASIEEVNYTFEGQPYILTQYDMARWRREFQGSGNQDFPRSFATDFSTVKSLGNPQLYFYPPPNGAFTVLIPYFAKHAYIVTPETDANPPWFPSSTYLYTRVAGELMKIADDARAMEYLGDGTDKKKGMAADILTKYLIMKDDTEGYAKTVKLDGNRFGKSNWNNLPNTKLIGW